LITAQEGNGFQLPAHGRGRGHGKENPVRRYVADPFDARCKIPL